MLRIKDKYRKTMYSKNCEEGEDSPGGGCTVAGQGLSADLRFTPHSRLLL